MRSGSKYALQVGDKTYTLSGDSRELEPFAGKKVKASGHMKSDTWPPSEKREIRT